MTQRDLAAVVARPQSWVQKCETAERRVDVAEFVLWCGGCGADAAEALIALKKLVPARERPGRGGPPEKERSVGK